MPFDGSAVNRAALMIDALIDFFGPKGEHWMIGSMGDGHGNACLVGAIRAQARHRPELRNAAVGRFIKLALREVNWRGTLIGFNDDHHYGDILAVLKRARELAEEGHERSRSLAGAGQRSLAGAAV